MTTMMSLVTRARRAHVTEFGEEPTSEQLATKLETDVAHIELAKRSAMTPASLDAPIGEDATTTLGDMVEDESARSPLEAAMSAHVAGQAIHLLDKLPARERQILRLRFGIGEAEPHTLEQIGNVFAITRERVRQIEVKALARLRRSRAEELRGLAEGLGH